MRLLIAILALAPVAVLGAVLLRSRFEARVKARKIRQTQIDNLLLEHEDLKEQDRIAEVQRELDAAIARREKKKDKEAAPDE